MDIYGKVVRRFPDGVSVYLNDGSIKGRLFLQECERGEHPGVVLVFCKLATGSGLSIRKGADESYFLPAPVTRGARGATDEELTSVPEWARHAYHWWMES